MNEVFNSGLKFWQLITGLITLTFSIVAIKIAINFDVNKYLERRDKKLNQKLKNICPHLEMIPVDDDNFQIRSLFESPPGTHQWQCRRCGLIKNHDNDFDDRATHYSQNPNEYLEQNKKFSKLLKKSGLA